MEANVIHRNNNFAIRIGPSSGKLRHKGPIGQRTGVCKLFRWTNSLNVNWIEEGEGVDSLDDFPPKSYVPGGRRIKWGKIFPPQKNCNWTPVRFPQVQRKLAWFTPGRRGKKSWGSRVDGLLTPAGSKSATPDNRQLQRDESRSTINDHYNYEERAPRSLDWLTFCAE